MPLRKSLRKTICLSRFLMQTEVLYSGKRKKKKLPQRTFISKEESKHQGLRQEGTGWLHCSVQMQSGLWVGLPLSIKLPTPEPGREKIPPAARSWVFHNKAWTVRTLFLNWFHQCLVPDVRKYLTIKGMPFQVLILDSASGHPEPHEFNTNGVQVAYLPQTQSGDLDDDPLPLTEQ